MNACWQFHAKLGRRCSSIHGTGQDAFWRVEESHCVCLVDSLFNQRIPPFISERMGDRRTLVLRVLARGSRGIQIAALQSVTLCQRRNDLRRIWRQLRFCADLRRCDQQSETSAEMIFFVLACIVPAFLVSVTATGAMRVLSPKIGLIDQPAARKVHKAPTALGGGIGIWLGVVLPLATVQLIAWLVHRGAIPGEWIPKVLVPHLDGVLYRSGQMWAVLAGGTVLSIMGLIDDLIDLPWKPRLVLQFCVAAGLVWSGVRATAFLGVLAIEALISVLWLVVLMNSFNFLDNMDGLSSGIALIASLLFAVIMLTSLSEPHWLVGGSLLILSGSLLGFLCHNWPPARIFMGDTGSYFIGIMLASMVVLGTFYESAGAGQHGRHVILAPLCVLAVPLYDFVSVLLIRLIERRSPFKPDKSHFSHRLVQLGLKPKYAVLTVHLATLTTGLGALLLYRVTDWSGASLVFALVLCVLTIIAILETVGRGNIQSLESRGAETTEPPPTGIDVAGR